MVMMNTVIEQIQRMDNDQLNTVIQAIKQQRTWNAQQVTRGLRVGDRVSFPLRAWSDDGRIRTGTITKVNRKTVYVDGAWKVPASMITVEDKEDALA